MSLPSAFVGSLRSYFKKAFKLKNYYVYIMASKKNGVLYIGVTNDLIRRCDEHRNYEIEGFTSKYHVHRLVHFEETEDVYSAIEREKALKKWNRDWKVKLIERGNPEWRDLYEDIVG